MKPHLYIIRHPNNLSYQVCKDPEELSTEYVPIEELEELKKEIEWRDQSIHCFRETEAKFSKAIKLMNAKLKIAEGALWDISNEMIICKEGSMQPDSELLKHHALEALEAIRADKPNPMTEADIGEFMEANKDLMDDLAKSGD